MMVSNSCSSYISSSESRLIELIEDVSWESSELGTLLTSSNMNDGPERCRGGVVGLGVSVAYAVRIILVSLAFP